jgi:hypothetical protein
MQPVPDSDPGWSKLQNEPISGGTFKRSLWVLFTKRTQNIAFSTSKQGMAQKTNPKSERSADPDFTSGNEPNSNPFLGFLGSWVLAFLGPYIVVLQNEPKTTPFYPNRCNLSPRDL